MPLRSALLAVLAFVAEAQAPPPVRRPDRPFAVWVAPQITFHSFGSGRADIAGSDVGVLPLGLEAGWQVHGPLLISFGLARFPVANIQRTQATLGARWYLSDGLVAPYLAAEIGRMRQELDDTGGATADHSFAAAGAGVEVATTSGFSLTTDFELGPEYQSSYAGASWHLSAWLRLGLGYRF
jgi:hypothetical protein